VYRISKRDETPLSTHRGKGWAFSKKREIMVKKVGRFSKGQKGILSVNQRSVGKKIAPGGGKGEFHRGGEKGI